jgi:hypothetical protein
MKILISVGLVLIIFALVWQFAIFPALAKLPADHHKIVNFEGTYKVMNPQTQSLDEIPVVVTREQQAIEVQDNVLIIDQVITTSHAESGMELAQFGLTEELGVERSKREYVPGYGDIDRSGQFCFPEKVEKKSYHFWIPTAGHTLETTFVDEEEFHGLKVFTFEINEEDVDIGIHPTANMQQLLDVSVTMKVEPVSGTTVSSESVNTIKIVPMPDMKVPIYISDITFTDDTMTDLLDIAGSARTQLLWARVYGFWLVIGLGIILTLVGVVGIIRARPREAVQVASSGE